MVTEIFGFQWVPEAGGGRGRPLGFQGFLGWRLRKSCLPPPRSLPLHVVTPAWHIIKNCGWKLKPKPSRLVLEDSGICLKCFDFKYELKFGEALGVIIMPLPSLNMRMNNKNACYRPSGHGGNFAFSGI